MSTLDFLVIGHVSIDVSPAGPLLGGTVTFAAITARNLGLRAGILTRASLPIENEPLYRDIEICRLPSGVTTTFRNTYTLDGRSQTISSVAGGIDAGDIPDLWLETPIVLLGPIAREVSGHITTMFKKALIGATPQGWLRKWDAKGLVTSGEVEQLPDLRAVHVAILSQEDIAGRQSVLERLREHCPIVVLTAGHDGAILYMGANRVQVATRPAREVDPTGGGDVFAAAFMVHYSETGDVEQSARFANRVAGLSVQAPGAGGIPSRQDLERQKDK